MSDPVKEHGWTAVPRSLEKLIADREDPKPPGEMTVDGIPLPNSDLAKQVTQYAKANLPRQTFNHSMRVYYFGQAIQAQHFPSWSLNAETYLLTTLLHDLGTTPSNQTSTLLSFEFHGAMLSLNLLKAIHSPVSQAEAVAEAIIRHQDLGKTGNITTLTALTHFATVLDNTGLYSELVHPDTIKSIVSRFPREGWTDCFASVLRTQLEEKPWSNSSRIEGFVVMVEGNDVMSAYD